MVELRKRKTPPQPPPAAAPAKKKSSGNLVKNVVEKAKSAVSGASGPSATAITGTASTSPGSGIKGFPAVGSSIDLDGFGGEVETHDGKKVTLKQLVSESDGGVVLFTYPKASTPGCTKQACMFRDDYTPLTATGLSIFGLSRDSPNANTNFKTKQNLPYALLCDPKGTLVEAIGLGQQKGKTTRGVFVIDRSGKVLAAEAGGPEPTVQVVKKLVTNGGHSAVPVTKVEGDNAADGAVSTAEDTKQAETAAQVADTAAKLDPPATATGTT